MHSVISELLTVQSNQNAIYRSVENDYDPSVSDSEIFPYRVFGADERKIVDIHPI